MWQDASLDESPEHYFCPDQYLMADTAFRASRCVVPAFARSRKGAPRPREHDVLNTAFEAPQRVSSDCIALPQGRFPWLRSIPLKLTDDESSMRKILMNIESCIVLHNLLVQLNDHLDPEACSADRDEISDIDDPGPDE
jgi:DDE superfamily endonuclease